MKIYLALLLFVLCSCMQKRNGIKLRPNQKDSAKAVAERFFAKWYDSTVIITMQTAVPASMKSFFIFYKIIGCGTDRYSEVVGKVRELKKEASDTNSIIEVSAFVEKYDLFTKQNKIIGAAKAFMDTNFNIMFIHCDSGIVYRRF